MPATVPTQREKKNVRREVQRSMALKVDVTHTDPTDLEAVSSFLGILNRKADALMIAYAYLLGWLDDDERKSDLLGRVLVHAPEVRALCASLDTDSERKPGIAAYIFAFVLRGARCWDAFHGIASTTKTEFGSARKEIEKLIAAAEKELTKFTDSDTVSRAEVQDLPAHPRLRTAATELSQLRAALSVMDGLRAGAASADARRPLSACLAEIQFLSRQLQKAVVEAACQKLLGYHELLQLWHNDAHELALEEYRAGKEPDYAAYLVFREQQKQLMQELLEAPRNPAAFAALICRPEIRNFREDRTPDEELKDLGPEALAKASQAIAWFRLQHHRYCKFQRGPGKRPTLTFIDDAHPFHFTVPGARTATGWYELVRLPSTKQRGLIRVRVLNASGVESDVELPFAARPELQNLQPVAGSKGKDFTYTENLGHAGGGKSVTRRAALAGLRYRPKGTNLYLDLVIKLEGEEWQAPAKLVEFDKKNAAFKLPDGITAAVIAPAGDGSLWGVRAQFANGTWQFRSASELTYVDRRWPKLQPVTVLTGPGLDTARRQVTKPEFGLLVSAVQKHSRGRTKWLQALVPPTDLAAVVPGADAATWQLLKDHLEQRNARAQRAAPPSVHKKTFSIGTLREQDLRIDGLVSRLKLRSNLCRELLQSVRTQASPELQLRLQQHRKIRTKLTLKLKAARKHGLNVRDNRVKQAVHAVSDFMRGIGSKFGKVDLLILPAKPPQDSLYKRSKIGKARADNRLLGLSRTGELCDRITDAAELFGVRTLRAATNRTDSICPKCGAPGVRFTRTRTSPTAPAEIASTTRPRTAPKRKPNETAKAAGKCKKIPPLPQPMRFGCVHDGCRYQNDERHVTALNMLARVVLGRAFGVLPEGIEKLTPAAAFKKLQAQLSA